MRVLFFLVFITVFATGCADQRNIHIIPKGFTGMVTIIHSQPTGQDIKLDGERRIYEIPPCGIMKVKIDPYTKLVAAPGEKKYLLFLYRDAKTGAVDTLTYLDYEDRPDMSRLNEVFVFPKSLGGVVINGVQYHDVVQYGVDTLKNAPNYDNHALSQQQIDACEPKI